MTSGNPLRVEVSKLEKGMAHLVLPDKQRFEVSMKYLPKSAKEGDILYLDFVSEGQLNQNKKDTARAVLEEILG